MNFTKSLLKHIDKLVGTLRSDEQIQEILKRKFTKKEYKVFVAFEEGKSIEEIKALVKEDDEKAMTVQCGRQVAACSGAQLHSGSDLTQHDGRLILTHAISSCHLSPSPLDTFHLLRCSPNISVH